MKHYICKKNHIFKMNKMGRERGKNRVLFEFRLKYDPLFLNFRTEDFNPCSVFTGDSSGEKFHHDLQDRSN